MDKNILVSPITLKNYLPEDNDKLNKVNYLNQLKDSFGDMITHHIADTLVTSTITHIIHKI